MAPSKPAPDFAELASRVPRGGHIVIHSDFAEPAALLRQLVANADLFDGVNLHTLMPMAPPPYAEPDAARRLVINSFFPGAGLRRAVSEGLVLSRRCALSEIPGFFERQEIRADLLLLQVSPPDDSGRVSLGISVDYMPAVLAQQPLVVAQVNRHMPFTCGDSALPLDIVDYVLEADEPLTELSAGEPDAVDGAIAGHVAGLIDDGDVLQTGIGALPDAVINKLDHLRHLGVHTGILSAGWQRLIENGVVDNSRKRQFTGVSVTTMAGGDGHFYGFLHRNPSVEFHPCSLTHNHAVLSGIEHLCAINSVLQLDLSGRANAEAVNGRQISTPGGLPDFARGAMAAPGGKSIIALRASFKAGAVSNILPALDANGPVTLDASAISHVVTEYGVAAIAGLDPKSRARALIAIAHPDHHDTLLRHLSERRQ